ncbi:hypothetical protein BDD12DRAFT_210029 [Trichophaea hybrida]|nr:hypothetical protein BDD12DRAFT_210029 [Trichophaea hybrida]
MRDTASGFLPQSRISLQRVTMPLITRHSSLQLDAVHLWTGTSMVIRFLSGSTPQIPYSASFGYHSHRVSLSDSRTRSTKTIRNRANLELKPRARISRYLVSQSYEFKRPIVRGATRSKSFDVFAIHPTWHYFTFNVTALNGQCAKTGVKLKWASFRGVGLLRYHASKRHAFDGVHFSSVPYGMRG